VGALLGRGVRHGQRRAGAAGELPLGIGHEGHAEVGQVGIAVTVDQHVLRFHIAMDDTMAMGRPERVGDLGEGRRGAIGRQSSEGESVGEGAGLDQAHHQVGGSGLAPVVVERDDVRVFERGDELGFGLEPADERGVIGELGLDHLDRHFASDGWLVGAEDRAERASPELLA
jgi:hypothetical protein